MYTTLIITFFLSVLAAAVPLEERGPGCRPNFQGSAMVVSRGAARLIASGPPAVGVTVSLGIGRIQPIVPQFTGAPNNDYLFRVAGVPDNSLLIRLNSGGSLVMDVVPPTNPPSFTLSCGFCKSPDTPYRSGTLVASQCLVTNTLDGRVLFGGARVDFTAA